MILYFDFLCPYAWRGVELLSGLELPFEPVHYSLVQGNHPENAGLLRSAPAWWLSEQPLGGSDAHTQSLEAFLMSQAAKLQGEALHRRFILELFRIKHVQKRSLDTAAALEAATLAGLQLERLKADRADETARRAELRLELERAAVLSVFGTPTIVLDSGEAAYFRFATLPETRAAQLESWELFQQALRNPAQIETIKRPRAGTKA